MKKFGTVLLVLACVFSLCSCGKLPWSDPEGEDVFSKTITSLFLALDSGNRDAVINLFSHAAQKQDKNLEEDIEKLFSVYVGPVDEIGWRGIKGTSSSFEDGDRVKSVFAHFPVQCGEIYYWCWMNVMYENTTDGDQIGITQLNFYTADEWYLSGISNDVIVADDVGLTVFSDNILDEDIRCIRGAPFIYAERPPLDLEEIKGFLRIPIVFQNLLRNSAIRM